MAKKTKQTKQSWELANPWHFQQKLRGGRIHTDKSKQIPRKAKYKNKDIL
jgi:hypothetical protein